MTETDDTAEFLGQPSPNHEAIHAKMYAAYGDAVRRLVAESAKRVAALPPSRTPDTPGRPA